MLRKRFQILLGFLFGLGFLLKQRPAILCNSSNVNTDSRAIVDLFSTWLLALSICIWIRWVLGLFYSLILFSLQVHLVSINLCYHCLSFKGNLLLKPTVICISRLQVQCWSQAHQNPDQGGAVSHYREESLQRTFSKNWSSPQLFFKHKWKMSLLKLKKEERK